MTDCQKIDTLMTGVLSGTADEGDRLRLEDHCAGCASCRSEFEARSAVMRQITGLTRPDPGAAFWDGFHDRLEARMREERVEAAPATEAPRPIRSAVPGSYRAPDGGGFMESLRRLLAPMPAWSLQLAAAVLLVSVGIAIGRQSPGDHVADSVTARNAEPADARHAALEQQALDTIGRSRTLLLGLVNFDPASENTSSLDIPTRRTMARRLAADASALKGDLARADSRRLSELISDLEIILIQIANLEANADIPAIEILQSSVDRGAIMFKIDVEQMRRANGLGGSLEHSSGPAPPGGNRPNEGSTADPAV